jgi:hypothetical protein
MKFKRKQPSSRNFPCTSIQLISMLVSFLLGCILSSSILLHNKAVQSTNAQFPPSLLNPSKNGQLSHGNANYNHNNESHELSSEKGSGTEISEWRAPLQGVRVLVCLASYDFGQFPLLEEVLDSYQDFCMAGASIDLYIHTVIPYTVGLIDLLNARVSCAGMKVVIAVQSPAVRLNLVDRHRELFYEKIDDYDLFIYSEVSSLCASLF